MFSLKLAWSIIYLPFSELLSEFLAPLANPVPNRIGQREMFTVYSFVDQGIKFVGIRRFKGPQNKQFPAAGNDRRMALKGIVGQSAKGTLCFAQTASLHFGPKIDCIWTIVNLNCREIAPEDDPSAVRRDIFVGQ